MDMSCCAVWTFLASRHLHTYIHHPMPDARLNIGFVKAFSINEMNFAKTKIRMYIHTDTSSTIYMYMCSLSHIHNIYYLLLIYHHIHTFIQTHTHCSVYVHCIL
jgi:hypothetical protein